MQERIVTYQCFTFPGMRKGVENGFKTPDVKTLGVLQPRNYTTINYALNTFEESQLMNKKT